MLNISSKLFNKVACYMQSYMLIKCSVKFYFFSTLHTKALPKYFHFSTSFLFLLLSEALIKVFRIRSPNSKYEPVREKTNNLGF